MNILYHGHAQVRVFVSSCTVAHPCSSSAFTCPRNIYSRSDLLNGHAVGKLNQELDLSWITLQAEAYTHSMAELDVTYCTNTGTMVAFQYGHTLILLG